MDWDEKQSECFTFEELVECLCHYVPYRIICVRVLSEKLFTGKYVLEVVEELEDGIRRKDVYSYYNMGSSDFFWSNAYLEKYDKRLR